MVMNATKPSYSASCDKLPEQQNILIKQRNALDSRKELKGAESPCNALETKRTRNIA
jgi:hypothetical protein